MVAAVPPNVHTLLRSSLVTGWATLWKPCFGVFRVRGEINHGMVTRLMYFMGLDLWGGVAWITVFNLAWLMIRLGLSLGWLSKVASLGGDDIAF